MPGIKRYNIEIGKIYGDWVAISWDKIHGIWTCKCHKCGRIKTMSGGKLANHVFECKNCHKHIRKTRINVHYNIEIGKTYGDLTVDSYDKKTGLWGCTCKCSQTMKKCHSKKIYENYKCKHQSKYIIKIGEKYGKYTVIEKDNTKPNNYWICQCDCGTKKSIKAWALKTAKQTQCIECQRKSYIRDNILVMYNRIYNRYKYGAKKRKYEFKLSFEDFCNLINQNCYYCGSEPLNEFKHKNHKTVLYSGIDRKDNTKGYTNENCVSCCKRCNMMKCDDSYSEWIQWLDKIANYRHK